MISCGVYRLGRYSSNSTPAPETAARIPPAASKAVTSDTYRLIPIRHTTINSPAAKRIDHSISFLLIFSTLLPLGAARHEFQRNIHALRDLLGGHAVFGKASAYGRNGLSHLDDMSVPVISPPDRVSIRELKWISAFMLFSLLPEPIRKRASGSSGHSPWGRWCRSYQSVPCLPASAW